MYENILDVLSLLGRAFHVGQVLFIAELVDPVLRDLALVVEVALVADEKEDGVFFGVGLYFVHPKLADIFKAEEVGEVKHQQDPLTASVVSTGDGPEPFLAGSVPDLELNIFVINLDGLESEIDADGCQVVF